MKTTTTTPKTAIQKLVEFVNQRPGLDWHNYGDVKSWRAESREITKDRADFFELLSFASWRINNLEDKITFNLKNSSGRLTMNEKGNIEYVTGQYFPTEYRPAACRILSKIIWNDYINEMIDTPKDGMIPAYKDGHEVRKAIKRNVSRRVANNYFN